jgi:hypothetical protein
MSESSDNDTDMDKKSYLISTLSTEIYEKLHLRCKNCRVKLFYITL